jgi:putative membrane protein
MLKLSTILASVAVSLAVSAGGAQAQQADKESQSFIKNAIEGNIAEVDVGKLAREKGKNPAVKKFGQMLVDDHSKANEKAKAAANQAQVEPPTGSSLTEKGTYAKLKILQGDTFDRSFANTMVSDHEKDIKDYEKAARKNNAVGHYAQEALPTLRTHLQHAKALQQQLKGQTTGSR